MNNIFIVGTDTGAGKTWYGCSLVKKGKKVIKPIETGKNTFNDLNESDSGIYASMQNLELADINLYFLNEPASPHYAAEVDKVTIEINKVKEFINNNDGVVVELAGGLLVPITRGYTQLDLIKEMNGKVDLVINNKLGAINHSLMTIKILIDNNIEINELVFNDFNESNVIKEDNKKTILEFYNLYKNNNANKNVKTELA